MQTTELFLEEIDYTKEMLDLELHYDSILDYQETERCLAYTDKEKTICDVTEPVVQYLYKTTTPAPLDVISKNTRKLDDNTYQIFGSDTYYQEEGADYYVYTEFGISEKGDFDVYQADQLKNVDVISKINNPFKIYKVNAQSPIYPGVDSWTRRFASSAGWDSIQSGNGTTVDASSELYIGWYTDDDQIYRTRLTYDTSALSDTVASSTLVIFRKGTNGASTYNFGINVYGLNPANETTAGNSDYENSLTTAFSTTINKNSTSNDTGLVFLLNSDGENNIDINGYSHFSIRTTNDATDSDPGDNSYAQYYFYSSENAGTTYDPYLLIETEVAVSTTTPTSTTTLSELPELPFVDDLTIITGRTEHYETSTTVPDWIEYQYYRIPFLVWVILAIPLLWIANRLLLEFLIRWRK